jgi:hypothetical protein
MVENGRYVVVMRRTRESMERKKGEARELAWKKIETSGNVPLCHVA